jgi:hypothetical protein
MARKNLMLADGELEKVLHAATQGGEPVDLDFGPGWVALAYDDLSPLPWAVGHLAYLRGVGLENTDGGGI